MAPVASAVKELSGLAEDASFVCFEVFVLRLPHLYEASLSQGASISTSGKHAVGGSLRVPSPSVGRRKSNNLSSSGHRTPSPAQVAAMAKMQACDVALAAAVEKRFRKLAKRSNEGAVNNIAKLLCAWIIHRRRHKLTSWLKIFLEEWVGPFQAQANAVKLCLIRRAPPACLKQAARQTSRTRQKKKGSANKLKNLMATGYSLFNVDVRVIAEHLTLKESGEFAKIGMRELLGGAWRKEGKEDAASHVVFLVDRFNKMSHWASVTVCMEAIPAKRAELISCFIMLASALCDISNFNACMSIMGGLNNVAVQRLKNSWRLLGDRMMERWDELNERMETKNNYATYRAALAAAEPPVVPFLGVYLRDLTFIEDGNPDIVAKGKINVEKVVMVGEVLASVKEHQQWRFLPQEDYFQPGLLITIDHSWLLWTSDQSDDQLWELSILHEPPAAAS